jgi:hypothetical protein
MHGKQDKRVGDVYELAREDNPSKWTKQFLLQREVSGKKSASNKVWASPRHLGLQSKVPKGRMLGSLARSRNRK